LAGASHNLSFKEAQVLSATFLAFHFCPQTFFGPVYNGDAVVSENLSTPVQARWLKFLPQEPWMQNENYLCMRVDVLSCQNGKLNSISKFLLSSQ